MEAVVRLQLAEPDRLRFLEALDRLVETMLLQALASRARREIEAQRAVETQRERTHALARDLLRQDLEAAFGLTTLSLLQTTIAAQNPARTPMRSSTLPTSNKPTPYARLNQDTMAP